MKLLLVILSLVLLSLVPAQPRVASADIVFKNGTVYTANDRAPKAQAIAVKGDRIVYVGTNAGAQKYVARALALLIYRARQCCPDLLMLTNIFPASASAR